MRHVEKMNELVADLAVLNVKLHNVHWNVIGPQFVRIHEFTEAIYTETFTQFDAVAEAVKMRGVQPFANLKDYLANTKIEELASDRSYQVNEALEIVLKDIQFLKVKSVGVRSEAEAQGDFEVVALMEGHITGYNKHIWFIQSMLK